MKKVLALVLAVMMLATVAFAANVVPGKKIKLERDSGELVKADGVTVSVKVSNKNEDTADAFPWLDLGDPDAADDLAKALNSDNYRITKIKYNEGRNLIDTIDLDDDDEQVVITLVQDYENTKEKEFDVEFTIDGRGRYTPDGTEDSEPVPDVEVRVSGTVGYDLQPVDLDDDEVDLTGVGDLSKALVEFKKADDRAYATLYHDYDSDLTLEARVYDGDKLYLDCDNDPDTDVLKANADVDGDLYFYNFSGEPTFNSTAKLYFYNADEDCYVYELNNGRLSEVGSYSDDDGCWVVRARTLGSYVVSTEELVNAADEDGDTSTEPDVENPDTGANDVVGIAAALGVVALVSAAAVSLKK